MSPHYAELVTVDAHVAASLPDHVTFTVHMAGWPKQAKAYADPGSKCAAAQRAAEGVLGNTCAFLCMRRPTSNQPLCTQNANSLRALKWHVGCCKDRAHQLHPVCGRCQGSCAGDARTAGMRQSQRCCLDTMPCTGLVVKALSILVELNSRHADTTHTILPDLQ